MFKRKFIEVLKRTINSLEEELQNEKQKNSYLEKDLVIVLDNERINRKKITDLENNIEFLYNNLSAQKKKLLRPEN